MTRHDTTDKKRFFRFVENSHDLNACWLWTGAVLKGTKSDMVNRKTWRNL